MKGYDKNKESSYLKYWDMSQKLPVNDFKWVENTSQFKEDFIKSYNENSDEGNFLEVDFQYPEELNELHNGSRFLPERIKIEKVEKLVTNFDDKKEYAIHIKKFETSIKSWISFSKSA